MLVSAVGILKYLKFTTRQDGCREEPVRQVREAEQVVWVGEPLQQPSEKWWNSQAFYTAGLMSLKEAGVQAWRVAEEEQEQTCWPRPLRQETNRRRQKKTKERKHRTTLEDTTGRCSDGHNRL